MADTAVDTGNEKKAKAKEIVALRDREKSNQNNFRGLWQNVADLVFPQTYGITSTTAPGEQLMTNLFDTTAIEESENMTSGLVNNLFPAGQRFFAIIPAFVNEDATVKRYIQFLTELVHEAIFNSNFIAQVSNTIQYWLTFGTGALYSDWTVQDGLNFRDYAIGTYQCLENANGVIDTIILTCPMTARQIVQKFGGAEDLEWESKVGRSVKAAYDKPESREDKFDVIQVVRPRKEYDENPLLRRADRMPFESVYIQEKDEILLDEGGYDEFPFAMPRFQVRYREVYGRGRGTMLLPQIRVLNRQARNYLDMTNMWVTPPLEILESFEGTVDLTPGGQNFVTEANTIRAVEYGARGAYPAMKDVLEYYRQDIREGFFKGAFEPITPLQGDRRNTTEIIERLKEGMKKLSKPLGRLFTELIKPKVKRSALLLIRNGQAPPPPPQLQGTPLKIELINPLALALRDQQSRGLQYWVSAGMEMEQSPHFQDVLDNVDGDKAYRDLGESLGVKTTHIRPAAERDALREQRARAAAAQRQMETALAAAEGYKNATKAPEAGSPAEALIGAS